MLRGIHSTCWHMCECGVTYWLDWLDALERVQVGGGNGRKVFRQILFVQISCDVFMITITTLITDPLSQLPILLSHSMILFCGLLDEIFFWFDVTIYLSVVSGLSISPNHLSRHCSMEYFCVKPMQNHMRRYAWETLGKIWMRKMKQIFWKVMKMIKSIKVRFQFYALL